LELWELLYLFYMFVFNYYFFTKQCFILSKFYTKEIDMRFFCKKNILKVFLDNFKLFIKEKV